MTTALLINVQAPGGYQPGGGVLVVDPSQAVPGPGGRPVLTVGDVFDTLDLAALLPRGASYLQAITIATNSTSGPTLPFALEVIDVGGQIDPVPTVAPGDGPNEQAWFNVYVPELAQVRITNADTFATAEPCVVTIDAYAITAESRSRIQCCYNGSPALGFTPPGQPPEVITITPNSVSTGESIASIVTGSNFAPGDVIELDLLGAVTQLVTVFVNESTLDVTLPAPSIPPGVYIVQINRGGVIFTSSVTFTALEL